MADTGASPSRNPTSTAALPTAYRDVIAKPAEVYTQRVRRLAVEPGLAGKLALDATGGDALPLLAFTLAKLFEKFGADGNLTLARYEGIGGMGGSIDRALDDALRQAGAAGSEENLRKLIVPGLTTWDPEANAAKRLVARESDLLAGPRAVLKPLADAMVAQRLLTRGAEGEGRGAVTLEVAHEALLRRKPIEGWLAEEKDSLKLRDDVLREAKEWESRGKQADFVRRGTRLESAIDLAGQPAFAAAMAPAGAYLAAGRRLEKAGRRRARFFLLSIFTLMSGVIALLLARMYEHQLNGLIFRYARAHPVSNEAALALPKRQPFWDCAKTETDYSAHCPAMVVIPAGEFMMGSPDNEEDRSNDEGPRYKVSFRAPLAVAMHDVTFDQYDACAAAGGCKDAAADLGWGRDKRPVINVNWHNAQEYAAWLSAMTGQTYRLLTEAEWEYAARAGTQTRYYWGDEIGNGNANCDGCGSQWDKKQTAPVGSFKPNPFGLYDMHGNVWQWVQDCYVDNYKEAPNDGRAVTENEGCNRAVRGGSWILNPQYSRAAFRNRLEPDFRFNFLGFRVARVLFPPRTQ